MEPNTRAKIVSNFFLDGAKILFGSLVVGAFLPGTVDEQIPFLTVALGVAATIIFLLVADAAAKKGVS